VVTSSREAGDVRGSPLTAMMVYKSYMNTYHGVTLGLVT